MTKKCKICGVEGSLDSFYRNRSMADGHLNHCKECQIKKTLSYCNYNYNGSSDKIRKASLEYYYKHKDDDGFLKEKRERTRQHYRDNREAYILRRQKRRTLTGLGDVTLAQINKLIKDSNNICFWCDEEVDIMHLDHIYPLSKGGGHTISNIVVSCSSCNLSKGAKDPERWVNKILSEE